MTNLKARVIKANRLLQSKVGVGQVDEKIIRKCQNLIDNTDLDFSEMALEILDDLRRATEKAKSHRTIGNDQGLINELASIVMQIKGQAGMFGFELAGELSDIMLTFLESLDNIDDHVIEITEAHTKTLEIIFKNNMTGTGGEYGEQLRNELEDACKRYFSKVATGKEFAVKDEGDIFFVG